MKSQGEGQFFVVGNSVSTVLLVSLELFPPERGGSAVGKDSDRETEKRS